MRPTRSTRDHEHAAKGEICGFASSVPGYRISAEVQKRKLELVVEVAAEVWGSAV